MLLKQGVSPAKATFHTTIPNQQSELYSWFRRQTLPLLECQGFPLLCLCLPSDELRRRRGGGGGPQIPNWERGLSRLVTPQSFKSIPSIPIRLNLFLATSHSQIFNLLEIGQLAFSWLFFVALENKSKKNKFTISSKNLPFACLKAF